MSEKKQHDRHFPVRFTIAQRLVVAEVLPELSERMRLDESDQRVVALTVDELKQIGSQEGINLPTDTSHKDAETYNRLAKLSGPEFDRAYAQEMVKDHQKDIAEFKKGETEVQKPALKQFAQRELPTLQSHLELAQHMEAHVSREGMSKGKAGGASR